MHAVEQRSDSWFATHLPQRIVGGSTGDLLFEEHHLPVAFGEGHLEPLDRRRGVPEPAVDARQADGRT